MRIFQLWLRGETDKGLHSSEPQDDFQSFAEGFD